MKLSSYDRAKIDTLDDEIFYQNPRYVHHLSKSFRNRLTNLYDVCLYDHFVILDLMSSWVSHLPANRKFKKVIGHGLNKVELKSNNQLDEYWVQNLNKIQRIPFEDSTYDAALLVAGWQYLQYPEQVSLELSRIIKTDALLIISFTNRAFWSKSPNIWTNSSDMERIEYIKNILTTHGWRIEKIFHEQTFEKKFYGLYKQEGDPFFSVLARNNKCNN